MNEHITLDLDQDNPACYVILNNHPDFPEEQLYIRLDYFCADYTELDSSPLCHPECYTLVPIQFASRFTLQGAKARIQSGPLMAHYGRIYRYDYNEFCGWKATGEFSVDDEWLVGWEMVYVPSFDTRQTRLIYQVKA